MNHTENWKTTKKQHIKTKNAEKQAKKHMEHKITKKRNVLKTTNKKHIKNIRK